MRYSDDKGDRKISSYAAVLIILLFGSCMALMIVHTASTMALMPGTENGILSALTR